MLLNLSKCDVIVECFKIFYDYRNQILILRIINTYIYFMCYCFVYVSKKIIRLPWVKISIYYSSYIFVF